MEESTVRGLIVGGALTLIWLVASLVWGAVKTQSEGGRRFRLVAGVSVAALVLYTSVSLFGLAATAGTAAVLGVVAWVALGFRKP